MKVLPSSIKRIKRSLEARHLFKISSCHIPIRRTDLQHFMRLSSEKRNRISFSFLQTLAHNPFVFGWWPAWLPDCQPAIIIIIPKSVTSTTSLPLSTDDNNNTIVWMKCRVGWAGGLAHSVVASPRSPPAQCQSIRSHRGCKTRAQIVGLAPVLLRVSGESVEWTCLTSEISSYIATSYPILTPTTQS